MLNGLVYIKSVINNDTKPNYFEYPKQDNMDLTTVYLKGYADAEEKYKQKVKDRIEKYKKIQEEMTMKNHNTDNINDCYKYGDEAQKAMYKREACEELLKEK